jgi:hypothetical protein
MVSCHTADSTPVKQEVYGTVILPPLVFPVFILGYYLRVRLKSTIVYFPGRACSYHIHGTNALAYSPKCR